MTNKKIIKLLGVKREFVNVFDAPSRCNSTVGFRLNSETYLAKGVANVNDHLYKFWKHSLADVFGKVEGMDKDVIINIHDANKFRSMLNYFGKEFDIQLSCQFSLEHNAYIVKEIAVSNPELKINFACMELVFDWTEYTEELVAQKSSIDNEVSNFVLESFVLQSLLKLCSIGTLSSDDSTLNLKSENGVLTAFNVNYRKIVKTGFEQKFDKISIKSSLLGVLDQQKNWNVIVGSLPTGGTKWVLADDTRDIIVAVGGIVHDDENTEVDESAISEAFSSEFDKFIG